MKPAKLGLIHTSATLVPIFQQLCNEHLPGVNVFNIVDDSLIKDVIANGKLLPATARRVVDHVASAEEAGADRILVTCSSIGRAVEAAAALVSVPVLRVDQPMADMAVSKGRRIGVVATLPTTLEPTADLVQRRARIAGKEIVLTSRLCEGAFEALMGGNPALHDQMVAQALRELSAQVDVILLAQASMARVVDTLSEAERTVPILASPPEAVRYLASVINQV
ncbi:aspartate/glutamate racemase family protein [Dyadobacter fermentans]|uniref:Asp/Glu/hydantoin racemase n=1 Tax=Dyadobacter fermentans (strain ATCC 700827 / DSM 18053 / CIP 107007 / KCTC 52180 / NS114) TaxID=471854 RepID=C6VYK9_DYAFD|nr:aspartate/glutamate racemase family protein [Dyadobacter fermentans]ACT93364.1 Asp/Glu/hydantoin racemase [Dyadobacter fermentans DSM 18053]